MLRNRGNKDEQVHHFIRGLNMASFVLLLVLMESHSHGSSAALEKIPGYASIEECEAAGEIWMETDNIYAAKRFSCIPGPSS